MYSEYPAIRSAKSEWDHARPRRRLQLLKDAGFNFGMAHAYRKFDELPMEMKIDLNYSITRNKDKEAA
jgi:hypothetical protein